MFKCRDCGREFDEPKQLTDWVEFWGQNVPMHSYYCPYCGSDDYDESSIVDAEEDESAEYEKWEAER